MSDDSQSQAPVEEVQSGSEEAKKAAQERMKAAIEAKERGEEIQVDTASLESTAETSSKDSSDSERSKDDKTIKSVKIYSPFRVYYDGPALSVSAENLTGPFDVLHKHKNFMSLLIPCEIVVRSERGEERIKIDRGVMYVAGDKVSVFLDV